jgi:trigger factor
LKVTVESLPDSQVLLNIEIEPERVESSLNDAYKRLAPRTRVPGFRPGKAPRALVERHYGRETLLHEALDRLVPTVVSEAIEQEKLDIVDRPDLEIASLDPVVVKATVPVRPTVELGDYRSIRIEQAPIEVEPSQVDESLQSLRERYATVEPIERPVEEGDVVRADVRAVADGNELFSEEDAELRVTDEGLTSLPGLHDKLIGLAAGAGETFEVSIPEGDEHELAGRTITYTVHLKDVKARTLPELDDEFAKEVGEGFPTLQALRERIESDIRTRLETEAQHKLEEEALDKLVELATTEYPPQLIEREVERMMVDQGAPDDRRSFERLLQRAGLNEEQVRGQFRPTATERVRRSLVLSRLREVEGITVTPDDVDAELRRMTEGPNGEQLRQIFDTETGRQAIERSLLNQRVAERLRQIVRGEAPELGETAATETTADSPPTAPEEVESAPDAAGQEAEAAPETRPAE